jgi:acetyl-CoA synthetase
MVSMLNQFVRTDFTSQKDFEENYAVRVPENFNFAYDVADEWARRDPNKLAMDWCDDKGEAHEFTFADMRDQSNRMANFFAAQGIGKGDPVMLVLKRRYEFWFCVLALHKLGAVAVPATHLLTKKDFVYRCQAASIKMIVSCDDAHVMNAVNEARAESPTLKVCGKLGEAAEGWVSMEGYKDAPATFERPADTTCNDDMMLLYFTSGTTGMPKRVAHNFTYPLGHIITARFWHNLHDKSKHLTVADTGWAKAVWGKLYGQWICGAVVFTYDYDKFNAKELLRVVSEHKVTSFCAPPTIYRYLIKEDMRAYDLSALEYTTIAGEPLNPEVYEQFLAQTGLKMHECYGQTELAVALITSCYMEPNPGSMGRPSPAFNIALVDEYGNDVEAGEQGEIAVRIRPEDKVPGMFVGYYREPERTEDVWSEGLYRTGDMAWRDEDGYYWFIGRADDVIKSSGYRIGPFEVESALIEHPAVLDCAVTGVPDADRGAVVKATVMLARGYEASDALKKELQDHVKKVTAPYKYPRVVEFVDELPRTISGKTQRFKIRAADAGE